MRCVFLKLVVLGLALGISSQASVLEPKASYYGREIESGFGLLIVGGVPMLSYHALMRFRLGNRYPLYLGPDIQFGLGKQGHFFSLMPGAWYVFELQNNPTATLSLGLLAGPTFAQGLGNVPPAAFGVFLDAGISFEIEGLSTVRGQFRSGVVRGLFAVSGAMLIGFRFQ